MKKQPLQYVILSPDGIPVHFEETQDTPKEAWAAFEVWKKRYQRQGYYSTVKGYDRIKIPLEELKDACRLKEIHFNQ